MADSKRKKKMKNTQAMSQAIKKASIKSHEDSSPGNIRGSISYQKVMKWLSQKAQVPQQVNYL